MTYTNPKSLCTYVCKVYQLHIFLFLSDFWTFTLTSWHFKCLLQVERMMAKHFRTASNHIDLELKILFWQDKLGTAAPQPRLVE